MSLDHSDTLSQENKEAISSLTNELQSIIDHAVPLLSRQLHFQMGGHSVRGELIKEAIQAQNKRRQELRDFLQNHALNEVYKKIHGKMMEEEESLEESASYEIASTQEDILILLWLHGELFGPINPDNYEVDVQLMSDQINRIRELISYVFFTHIRGTPNEEDAFNTRIDTILDNLASYAKTYPQVGPNKSAENINANLRSVNDLLSHVRYNHSINIIILTVKIHKIYLNV